jgi:hypothetical protein
MELIAITERECFNQAAAMTAAPINGTLEQHPLPTSCQELPARS